MKKVRIKIKNDRYKRYDLFNSVEALYIWLSDRTPHDKFVRENEDCITTVELDEDGQWLEVEWMGCEFTKEHCMNYVRIARATPKEDGGFSLGIYAGWIHKDRLKFVDSEDSEVIVKRIDLEGKIDMESIVKSTPVL